ncbi:MAG: hypothetical protein NWE92_00375 [Candidatus Bathyarchaeota archaeon]|nr:hypothetical protein [Candidatus Bathyarchaeota archaeon]
MNQVLACVMVLAILILPAQTHNASDHLEYNIRLYGDGSATWKIIQVTDINTSIDGIDQFQQRLLDIVDSSKEVTARSMSLDLSSLEMKTDLHWETSSQTVQYIFRWVNFSIIKENKIIFGDVLTDDFFLGLYGNGELYITYPQEYSVYATSSPPDEENNAIQTLHWYRTQDLPTTEPNIELAKNNPSISLSITALWGVIGVTSAAIAVGAFTFNYRKQRKAVNQKVEPVWKETPSNQEQILRLLKTSGGRIKQSQICTELKFSRAKTSLLLTEMEKNNQIKRDKKGKNKLVYLQNKG